MKEKEEIPNEAVFLGARTFLLPEKITHLEADVNYTNVYLASGKRQTLSKTLSKVHNFLSTHGDFIRISKKHVVNMNYVDAQQKDRLLMENGLELGFSRRRGKAFLDRYS